MNAIIIGLCYSALEKCLENDFRSARLRTEMFFYGKEEFPHRGPAVNVFSQTAILSSLISEQLFIVQRHG